MDLDSFITKYNGQSIPNNHGKYVGECVSLAARYAQEVQGIPDGDGTLYCQSTGGARDLYENPTSLELQYYDLIPYGQPRLRGDLVVWGANLGEYGDIAIADNNGTVIFGQLGTPVFIPANIRNEPRPPLGYLRRKGGKVPELTPTQIDMVFQLGGVTSYKEDLANPAYAISAALLIETIFNQAGPRPKATPPANVTKLTPGQFYQA